MTPAEIVTKLIEELNLANDWQPVEQPLFIATDAQKLNLQLAVEQMLAAGCVFNEHDISELTDGDMDEVAQAYGRFDGFEILNTTLNEIFNMEQ